MIDAHLHLQDARLDPVRDSYLDSLSQVGIRTLFVNGTCEADWVAVESLAIRDPRVIPLFGIHPWRVGEVSETWTRALETLLKRHPEAGIGEIGLDRWIEGGDFERQKEVFAIQLGLAREFHRPVAVHCLQAWGTLLELCREAELTGGLLLHSFGGPAEMLAAFVELGAYFSISGYFFRSGKESKLDVFREIPIERLLIETDAPDMAPPREIRICEIPGESDGKWNHPGNLRAVYELAARLREISFDSLTSQIRCNVEAWYGRRLS